MPILPGNYNSDPYGDGILHFPPGYQAFIWEGTGRLAVSSGNVITIPLFDARDQPATIVASSTDPIYIAQTSFTLPRALTATNGDRLKVGIGATDNGSWVSASAVAASSLIAAGSFRNQNSPDTWPGRTANTTFALFLDNGANAAPAGTIALPNTAGLPSFIRIPVRIIYVRRLPAVQLADLELSPAAQRLDAGL